MSRERATEQVHPGIKWGPFVLRIPFVHLRLYISDLLQGIAVAGATGLALVPYFTSIFGLSFEEAVTMAMIHSLLISSAWMLFGDALAPGWLTPAIPFVITFITLPAYAGNPTLQFQAMTALSLDFAAVLILLGVTGLGSKLLDLVPKVLTGGIILGAALAAFLRVTREGDAANVFESAPIAGTIGVALCLMFAFSKPLHAMAAQHKWLASVLKLGLFPGFVLAGLIGFLTGEFTFDIQWEILNVPSTTASMWQKASPLVIGWPSIELLIDALPLALITYILFFGDLVTGQKMNEDAQPSRPDEKLEVSASRVHISTGIRNILMAIMAPFFATQGVLWTGIQVILLQRWASGRDQLESFFDGVSSYYVMGLPVLFVVLPFVTLLQPLLPVALAVTLILTGYACATLALSMVSDATERGAMVLTAMAFSVFEPWLGLLIGLVSIVVLVGPGVFVPQSKKVEI